MVSALQHQNIEYYTPLICYQQCIIRLQIIGFRAFLRQALIHETLMFDTMGTVDIFRESGMWGIALLTTKMTHFISFAVASQKRAKTSPPMPVDVGSVTFRAAAIATAASAAFPPF